MSEAQMMLRLLALTIVLALAGASSAHAAGRVVIRGAGAGHGVGMSQYGAYGLAQHGADRAAILAHYYTGTQIGRLDGSTRVRVLLRTASRIVFRGATAVAGERALNPRRRYVATRALGGTVALRSASGRELGRYQSPLAISGGGAGLRVFGRAQNGVGDGRYRGTLLVRATSLGGVAAIEDVAVEDYLRGVVAGEMPASWAPAALQAQAIAARTYAIGSDKGGDGFDHYADTRSQVYRGIAGEHPRTDAAVAATAGEVVVHDGRPIEAVYFSSSGGRTEDNENAFLGAAPAPYLRSVEDPYDDISPNHTWVKRMSLRTAQRRLGHAVRGSLLRIRVMRRGSSPRVVRAEVLGSRGRTRVSGPTLRARLGLLDTWARFTVITARGARGDGNAPVAPAAPAPATGGTMPRIARMAAAARAATAGTVRGRVAGDGGSAGGWVTVQKRAPGGRWVLECEALVRAGGRYVARVRTAGTYRIVYDGAIGDAVRVG